MFRFDNASDYFRRLRSNTNAQPLPEGLTPIGQYLETDIFIVGYPKSGNTWFQNLIAGAAFGVDSRLSPPALVHDLVPDVHFNEFYKRYASPMFFKSHDLPRPDYRRVVYLLRDGRDVMVSYRHYREIIDKRSYDFQQFVGPNTERYAGHWHKHVESWMKNPHSAELIVIKYEDLLLDPAHELNRFCAFVGIQRDESHLRAVAAANAFDNLRDKERQAGFGRADHLRASGPFFFRRSVAGSYKDEMPTAALAIFMRQSASTLRRFGYITE